MSPVGCVQTVLKDRKPVPGNAEERALIERIRNQDADALMILYRTHAPRVFSLSYRILRDRSAAEEVVQDAFWRLWQRPESFDPERGVLIAWLYAVSRNLALDRKRRENRRPCENVIHGMDGQVRGALSPEMAAMSDPLVAGAIREAINTLPSDQKRVIELAYFDGLTQTEIASQQGAALGTIKTRLRLGLSKLREAMRNHGTVKR